MFAIDAISGLVSTAVDKIWPDANIAAQSEADGLKQALVQELTATVGQLDINKIEAANASVFISGWRPAVGWCVALGYAYSFLVRPLGVGFASMWGLDVDLPQIDAQMLTDLLYSLLGLSGFRTVEKLRGVARH